ncbi:MAG TPA: Flp family type IVb pilin [Kaistiaceae bacterium]|nr:Flp family type IVb pilin [Kaistiaceae bacterium]
MRQVWIRFLRDERGTTVIEYTLIAAGIAVVIIGAIGAVGAAITDKFDGVSTTVTNFMSK